MKVDFICSESFDTSGYGTRNESDCQSGGSSGCEAVMKKMSWATVVYTSTVKGQNIGERTNTKSGTCDHMDSGSSSSCDFSCGAPDHKFKIICVWLSDGHTAIYFITYIV